MSTQASITDPATHRQAYQFPTRNHHMPRLWHPCLLLRATKHQLSLQHQAYYRIPRDTHPIPVIQGAQYPRHQGQEWAACTQLCHLLAPCRKCQRILQLVAPLHLLWLLHSMWMAVAATLETYCRKQLQTVARVNRWIRQRMAPHPRNLDAVRNRMVFAIMSTS